MSRLVSEDRGSHRVAERFEGARRVGFGIRRTEDRGYGDSSKEHDGAASSTVNAPHCRTEPAPMSTRPAPRWRRQES